MPQFTFKVCKPQEDRPAIVDLLVSLKSELYLPDRQVAAEITNRCFTHGGVIGGYDVTRLGGMMGYFYGEPDQDFANKKIAFLYVAGICEAYRRTGMFRQGLVFGLNEMQKQGAQSIRLQAETSNLYTNSLYGRFATALREDKNLRGIPVITYGGSIEDALHYLERRKRPLPQVFNPTPHAISA